MSLSWWIDWPIGRHWAQNLPSSKLNQWKCRSVHQLHGIDDAHNPLIHEITSRYAFNSNSKRSLDAPCSQGRYTRGTPLTWVSSPVFVPWNDDMRWLPRMARETDVHTRTPVIKRPRPSVFGRGLPHYKWAGDIYNSLPRQPHHK